MKTEISNSRRPSKPFARALFSTTGLCREVSLSGRLGALILLTAVPAVPVQAQQSSSSGVVLDEIIVTATPSTTPLKVVSDLKTPRQPVPASDGADYLKTIPGFNAIRNGGTNGDPVFRGMFGSRLNIRTDGGVILGACGGRMDNPTSYISPESYDQLTVIKGPQTVQWGPSASAATILFERQPRRFDKFTVEADNSVLAGSNGRFDARADATVGSQSAYVRMMANKARAGDYRDGDSNRVPSKWDKWNADLAVGITPNEDTVFEISGGLGDAQASYAGRGMDGSKFARETLGAKFSTENVNDYLGRIEAQLYYNYADHVMDNFRLRTPSGSKMESEVDRRTIGGRFATTWNLNDFSLLTGVDFQTNTHRGKEKKMMLVTDNWIRNSRYTDYGLFGELTWNISDTQRLIAGSRADAASAKDFRTTSATFNDTRAQTLYSGFVRHELDWSALPVTSYVGVGYVNRFPDFWELFSPKLVSGTAANAFEGIDSEKTFQIDFGAQYSIDGTDIWASGYLGWVNDFILFDYSGPQSLGTNVNARIMGGELGISRHVFSNWKIEASVAYSWGENTSDHEPLPQIPPLEGRFAITYEQENWSIGGLWRLVAAQDRLAPNKGNVVGKDYEESPGFGIVSINGRYKFGENVVLSAGVDNIFNKSYSEHLNRDGDAGFGFTSNYQLREPGRTFWATSSFKF